MPSLWLHWYEKNAIIKKSVSSRVDIGWCRVDRVANGSSESNTP